MIPSLRLIRCHHVILSTSFFSSLASIVSSTASYPLANCVRSTFPCQQEGHCYSKEIGAWIALCLCLCYFIVRVAGGCPHFGPVHSARQSRKNVEWPP